MRRHAHLCFELAEVVVVCATGVVAQLRARSMCACAYVWRCGEDGLHRRVLERRVWREEQRHAEHHGRRSRATRLTRRSFFF